jgi:hypothetical protein
MLNRIVLLDEAGDEMFSGVSLASDPPPALDEDACPPTKRSIAPPLTNEESGVFVRDASDATSLSAQKKVDERAA